MKKRSVVLVDGVLTRLCKAGCGTVVESTLRPSFNTRPTEFIVCPRCLTDNSLAIPPLKRLKLARYQFKRKRKILGSFFWLKYPVLNLFRLDREIHRRKLILEARSRMALVEKVQA